MPLVDDGIKYKSKNKKDGYDLIDGQKSTAISISKEKTWGIKKKLTPQQNYSTVSFKRCNVEFSAVEILFHLNII